LLDFAKHIVNQRSRRFDPEKDWYEIALVDLINQKRAGNPITPKELPAAQRRRPDGGTAPERRQRSGAGQGRQEAAEGGERCSRSDGPTSSDHRLPSITTECEHL
jgi:DNA end-binding protein Ku